jgi:DNA-binding NarL/FixJ family response regulator
VVAGLAVVLLDEGVAEWLFFAVLIGAAAVLRVSTMWPASSIACARPAFPCSSRETTRRLLDDYVRRPPPGVARPAALDPLTDRELEVLRLIARGRSNS